MVGKTTVRTDFGNIEVDHNDIHGQHLVSTIHQLEFENEKLEQRIVELECDKETWFTKYHDERTKRYKIQEIVDYLQLEINALKFWE
jgi:hypothetical protein